MTNYEGSIVSLNGPRVAKTATGCVYKLSQKG